MKLQIKHERWYSLSYVSLSYIIMEGYRIYNDNKPTLTTFTNISEANSFMDAITKGYIEEPQPLDEHPNVEAERIIKRMREESEENQPKKTIWQRISKALKI